MKIHCILLLSFPLVWGGVIHAATWIGPSSGSYQDGANWDTGIVPNYNASGGNTVNISGNVTVTDSGRRDWWDQTVTVSNGATLKCTNSVQKWQQGTVTVTNGGRIVISDSGTDMTINTANGGVPIVINCFSRDGIHIDDHVQMASATGTSTLNFGLEGSMYINELWQNNWNVTMSFTLDTGIASGASAIYSIETRTLVDLDHNTGGGVTNMAVASSLVKDLSDQTLTAVSSLSELTADASGLGKYYLYRDDANGGDWVCKYVKAGAAVPEPSVALMGIFGMAGLLLRRRR